MDVKLKLDQDILDRLDNLTDALVGLRGAIAHGVSTFDLGARTISGTFREIRPADERTIKVTMTPAMFRKWSEFNNSDNGA